MDQQALLKELAKRGHPTNKDRISRIVNGQLLSIDGLLVLAIAELGICKSPSGRVYTVEELLLTLAEEFDPFTDRQLQTARSPSQAAQFLAEKKGDLSAAEFGAKYRISGDRMTELLAGDSATLEECLKLSKLCPSEDMPSFACVWLLPS
jgi:hypothetical protein